MHELDPNLRDLLEHAKGADDPSVADQQRVGHALSARLGSGALALTTATVAKQATAASAVSVAAKVSLGLKFAAAVLVVGTVGAAVMSRHQASIPAPSPVASPAARPLAVPVTPPAQPSLSTLEQEVALIQESQRALRDGQPARALGVLDDLGRRFPHGALRAERLAARVLALCGLNKTGQAKHEAAALLREFPVSPLVGRIKASCAGSSAPGTDRP